MKTRGDLEVIYELNAIDQAVLAVAEKISREVQKIKYAELYYKAIRILNFPKIEISNAINKLYLKKYIIVGSRLTKGQILENPNRKMVFDYILSHLGAHIRELRENLSITPYLLNWHLNVLENFEYIFRVRFLKYVNFFPASFDRTVTSHFLVLKNENSLVIFRKCLETPLIDFETLKTSLDLQQSVIAYHLNNLVEFGIVFAREINGTIEFGVHHEKISPLKKYYSISDLELKNSILLQNSKLELSD